MSDRASYQHDVFISYRRVGFVTDFVRTLKPSLVAALGGVLAGGLPPRVFLDEQTPEAGAPPDWLLDHAHSSAVLLAVWVPTYGDSDWCLAEWETLRARERRFYQDGRRASLILPIVFTHVSGAPVRVRGEDRTVPPYADLRDAKWQKLKFPNARNPSAQFKQFASTVAQDLSAMIAAVPPWDPSFPKEKPPAPQSPPMPLPSRNPAPGL